MSNQEDIVGQALKNMGLPDPQEELRLGIARALRPDSEAFKRLTEGRWTQEPDEKPALAEAVANLKKALSWPTLNGFVAKDHQEVKRADLRVALDELDRLTSDAVPVSGIHLRTIGNRVQLLAEVGGEWRLVIDERNDGPISYIVEPSGIVSASVAP